MTNFYTSIERYGNNMLVRSIKDGQRQTETIQFKPTFYVPSKTKAEHISLDGDDVRPVTPGTMRDCKDFLERYQNVEGFKIYGSTDYVSQFTAERYPGGCDFDIDSINVAIIDIEVQSDQGFPVPELAAFPITAITIKSSIDGIFHTFGLGDYNVNARVLSNKEVVYYKCKDEADLICKFLLHWGVNYPDIVTGWNVEGFDIPYIINRTRRVLGEESLSMLSPWKKQPNSRDGTYTIVGVAQLDYLKLFRKFDYTYGPQESYKLDSIANVVLGEQKLDYSEYASLTELYQQDYQKFIDYNIIDVDLVDRIDDKSGLIALAVTIAHKANCTYEKAFGSVKLWETFIYNTLVQKGVVAEIKPKTTGWKHGNRSIEGGYVKDPQVGMHDWTISMDLNSLYPHIIMMLNISPESIADQIVPGVNVERLLAGQTFDIPPDTCMAATGQLFNTKHKAVFPQIVEKLYAERAQTKQDVLALKKKFDGNDYQIESKIAHLNNEQMAIKTMMNSLYGAMANRYFAYYDNAMAEAITISGQLSVRWAEKHMNDYVQKLLKTKTDYVLASDTDSIYIRVDDIVNSITKSTDPKKICAIIDKFVDSAFIPEVDKAFTELQRVLKAPEQKLVMKREIIANRIIFTGKKRYICSVLNDEGVLFDPPKIKATGIESVRSSTPKVCRELISDTVQLIMTGTEAEVQSQIATQRKIFKTHRAEEIAFPRGITDIEKYQISGTSFKSGTPIHCRAAIMYNRLLRKHNLENKFDVIRNGEKIKFAYLVMPNPTGENVIGFVDVLPPEFELEKYVDYELQFEKAFVQPIKTILDSIGWSTEHRATLASFFG